MLNADAMPHSAQSATELFARARAGNTEALTDLFPLLYDELRRLAARHIGREYGPRTLQATALVHEAYLRLVPEDDLASADRGPISSQLPPNRCGRC